MLQSSDVLMCHRRVLLGLGIALILGFTLTQPSGMPVNTTELGNAFGAASRACAAVHPLLTSSLSSCTHGTEDISSLWALRA